MPHLLHGMDCNGAEDSLLNCRYSRRLSLSSISSGNILSYRSYSAAAVICQGSPNQPSRGCVSGDVRLANSSSNGMEGRVEICTRGMWVSVCDQYWSRYEIYVFCRQLLGYSIPGIASLLYKCIISNVNTISAGIFHINGGYYGTGNNSIIPRVFCNNNYYTPGINSCRITYQLDSPRCYHGKNVGVLCQGMFRSVEPLSLPQCLPPLSLLQCPSLSLHS